MTDIESDVLSRRSYETFNSLSTNSTGIETDVPPVDVQQQAEKEEAAQPNDSSGRPIPRQLALFKSRHIQMMGLGM
jgi:hypothetical protein